MTARRTLYVERLAFTVERDDLVRLFGRYGTVHDAEVVTDAGRRAGIVEMSSEAEADAALVRLDGQAYIGQVLAVWCWDAPPGRAGPGHVRGPCGPGQPLPGGFGDRGGEGLGGAQFFVSAESLNRPPTFTTADWGPFTLLGRRLPAFSLAPPLRDRA